MYTLYPEPLGFVCHLTQIPHLPSLPHCKIHAYTVTVTVSCTIFQAYFNF